MKKTKNRIIPYKGFYIKQELKWVDNPHDGSGYEVKTTIKGLPKYSGFDQLAWLGTDKQKLKIEAAVLSAQFHINTALKDKEPTIFDQLGFK